MRMFWTHPGNGRATQFREPELLKDQHVKWEHHTWVENPFKCQERPMDFNGTENEKLTDFIFYVATHL